MPIDYTERYPYAKATSFVRMQASRRTELVEALIKDPAASACALAVSTKTDPRHVGFIKRGVRTALGCKNKKIRSDANSVAMATAKAHYALTSFEVAAVARGAYTKASILRGEAEIDFSGRVHRHRGSAKIAAKTEVQEVQEAKTVEAPPKPPQHAEQHTAPKEAMSAEGIPDPAGYGTRVAWIYVILDAQNGAVGCHEFIAMCKQKGWTCTRGTYRTAETRWRAAHGMPPLHKVRRGMRTRHQSNWMPKGVEAPAEPPKAKPPEPVTAPPRAATEVDLTDALCGAIPPILSWLRKYNVESVEISADGDVALSNDPSDAPPKIHVHVYVRV